AARTRRARRGRARAARGAGPGRSARGPGRQPHGRGPGMKLLDYGKRIEAWDGDGPDAKFLGDAVKNETCTGWSVRVGEGMSKFENTKEHAKRRLRILLEAAERAGRTGGMA